MRVAVSWSGGKDGCYACFKAMEGGFEVKKFLTMVSSGGKSSFHMTSADLLDAQSMAISIPIMKVKTKPEMYELYFKKALRQLRTTGLEGLVTGDIYDPAYHEPGWLERICRECDPKPIRPLWHRNSGQVLEEFVSLGFEAKIVRVKLEALGQEFLERDLDRDIYSELVKLEAVDPCGEAGECHTLVADGPMFKDRIEILETRRSTVNGWGKRN